MRRFSKLFSVIGLIFLTQSSALLAQPGRRGGGPTFNRATTLGIEQVREELELDDAQGATIQAALDAYREERREARPDRSQFQFLSDEEQQELRDQQQKQTEEASNKVDETLAALLKPKQLKRLDQIIIQFQLKVTPATVIRKQLELTDDQIAGLKTVEDEAVAKQLDMRFEMMKQFQGGKNIDFTEIRRIVEEFQKDMQTSAFAILTDSQKTKITELQGPQFDIDFISLMRNRGRGGRGR
jgi:hypothetical protein